MTATAGALVLGTVSVVLQAERTVMHYRDRRDREARHG